MQHRYAWLLVLSAVVGLGMTLNLRPGKGLSASRHSIQELVTRLVLPATERGEPERIINVDLYVPVARISSTGGSGAVPHRPSGWPVIVQLPGWGRARKESRHIAAVLAGIGFLVVALDDIALDEPYPDTGDEAARLASLDVASEVIAARTRLHSEKRAALGARKTVRVVDALGTAIRQWGLAADTRRVGVLGYSFGGAQAAEAAFLDRRIVAVVNLDGWQFGASTTAAVPVPFLMFNSAELIPDREALTGSRTDLTDETRINARWNHEWQQQQSRQVMARSDAYRYLIDGSIHGDFTDHVLTWRRWLGRLKVWPRRAAATAIVRIIDDHLAAFFLTHVAGEPIAWPEAGGYAHLRRLGANTDDIYPPKPGR